MIPIGTKITIQYHPEPWGTWINGWKDEQIETHPPVTVEYEINKKFIDFNPTTWEMLNRSSTLKEGSIIFGPGKKTTIKIIKVEYMTKPENIRAFRKKAKRADKQIKRLRNTVAGSSPYRLKLGNNNLNQIILKELKRPKKKQIPQPNKKSYGKPIFFTTSVLGKGFEGIHVKMSNQQCIINIDGHVLLDKSVIQKKICIKHAGSGEVKMVSKEWFHTFKKRDANWEEVPKFWFKRYTNLQDSLRKAIPHKNRIQPNSLFLRRIKERPLTTIKAKNKGNPNSRIKYIQLIPIKQEKELRYIFRKGILRKTKVCQSYFITQYKIIKHAA